MTGATRTTAPGALGGLAALVGGAAGLLIRRCQSCPPILVGLAVLAAMPATPAPAGQTLPATGLEITAFDIVAEPPLYRVRYLAPGVSDSAVSYVDVAEDMEHLCTHDALPRLLEQGEAPERIVVTLMAEPVDFGTMSPGIRQFFESYRVLDGLCIWEAF